MQVSETSPSISWRGIVGMAVYLLLMPALLFLAADTISWLMGWLFIGLLVAVILISRLIAWRRHPGLLAERSRFSEVEGVASWDRPIVAYIGGVGPILMLVTAGFNHRFGWTPAIPAWLVITGALSVVAGYVLATWAVASNRFFLRWCVFSVSATKRLLIRAHIDGFAIQDMREEPCQIWLRRSCWAPFGR